MYRDWDLLLQTLFYWGSNLGSLILAERDKIRSGIYEI